MTRDRMTWTASTARLSGREIRANKRLEKRIAELEATGLSNKDAPRCATTRVKTGVPVSPMPPRLVTYVTITSGKQTFVAERSTRERRFLWWVVPTGGKLDDLRRVAARDVPLRVRRRVYRQMTASERSEVPTSFKDVTAEKAGTLIAIIPAPHR